MFRNILVAIDGWKHSHRALHEAIDPAAAVDAKFAVGVTSRTTFG